jgi:AraC-like DNA-binding protein
VKRPDFACWGLEFVAEGEGTVTLKGKANRLLPGHAFVYGPGVAQEIRTNPERPMRKYFVDFFGYQSDRLMDKIAVRAGDLRRVAEPDVVKFLFDELIREGGKARSANREAADGYLRLILHKVAEIPAASEAARSPAYATWRRCQTVLDEQFCRIKGLRELSRVTRVDPSHLCRLFQRFARCTPHAELTRRKMNHAASRLLTTPELVKTIAHEVGFEDPLHFSRAFRRHFGRGPLAFQRAETRTGKGRGASANSRPRD